MKFSVLLIFLAIIFYGIFFAFSSIRESACNQFPIEVVNPNMADFEIVGVSEGCATTKSIQKYYLKSNLEQSEGYHKRNFIVSTKAGFRVDVKWVDSNVIQVTSYKEGSVSRISKSVLNHEVRLNTDYSWRDKTTN